MNTVGVETAANSALGVVGQVLGVVEPPSAVVIPEVVVRVAADTDGDRCVFHDACWELAHQKPEQQKTADPNQEAAVKARRDFCSADYSPPRIERHSPFSHRRISPSSVGSTGCPVRS